MPPDSDEEATLVSSVGTARPNGGGGVGGGGGPPGKPPIPPELTGDRYRVVRLLEQGGQGDVWLVADRLLEQDRALKIVRDGARPSSVKRFQLEIERTVRLAHPGVVPVFDRGVDGRGRPYFVMKYVDGHDLGRVIGDIFAGRRRHGLRRLIELLVRICDAVQFAHRQRCLHRDLTPRNIMVGRFGEALVMDWGLADDLPDGAAPAPVAGPPSTDIRPGGTTGYIAPECFVDVGRRDARMDVFGLGAILFKILTGSNPRGRAQHGMPAVWADGQDLPAELVEICRDAMHRDLDRRVSSAELLRQRLVDWLDGARRRDDALRLVSQARLLADGIDADRTRVEALRRQAEQALEAVPEHAPAAEKYEAWAMEDAAQAAADTFEMNELEYERLLGAALTRVPDLAPAHRMLARHHRARMAAAEQRRDGRAARRAEALLRQHDRGEHALWLEGDGRLTLHTAPARARITVHRLVSDRRRLVPGPIQTRPGLDAAPIVDAGLPRGSYLAFIEAEGRPPVRYPIAIAREEHWHGVPPGGEGPAPVPLIEPAPGALYVPLGWAALGGDPDAASALPRCRIWVDGFVMQRFSVTHRAWIEFLDDLRGRGERAAFERHQPRHRTGEPLYVEGPDGALALDDDFGVDRPSLDSPVALVDWFSATAYADWLAARTGHPWRLPTSLEWEKAARGVDGRFMPWGDVQEASWSRTVASFAGRATTVTVGECPEDESIYGVRDMAGTVRNWCISSYRADPPADRRDRILPPEGDLREVRGGSWASRPNLCRPAVRMASKADQRFRSIGVRLVYSV